LKVKWQRYGLVAVLLARPKRMDKLLADWDI
jgi:hypothetical protein